MANESYIKTGTALKIQNHNTPDYAWSVEGLTNGAGRVSAQIDLGASPRPGWYRWSCELQLQATPTQGKGVELYKAAADDGTSSRIDGDVGASDAALGDADMRRNLTQFGYVTSENAAASEKCIRSDYFFHPHRYLSLVAYNDSGASVNATASNFLFTLQPFSWQGQ